MTSAEFDAAVVAHLGTLRRYVVARNPAQDADDIVQDVLVRAWRYFATFDPERASLRTWLLAIAANQSKRTFHRRRQFRLAIDRLAIDRLGAGRAAGDRVGADPIEADLDLRRAIDRLSRRQRETVLLHYYVDLTVADVAILLGCSAGTVKSTLSDARTRLAELLRENADA